MGRAPSAPGAKKKSEVAECPDVASFDREGAVIVSLRVGGAGVGGPVVVKGEPKKAAVLLEVLGGSLGDGRGEGRRPSATLAVNMDSDLKGGFAELDETLCDNESVGFPGWGMGGLGMRDHWVMAGSTGSGIVCIARRRSSATIIYTGGIGYLLRTGE